jgi:hypothetical protein
MAWALIATVDQPITVWVPSKGTGVDTIEGYFNTITAQPGTIINMIVYDGTSEYQPPEGTKLMQVPDTTSMGATGFNL